jgi:hypothetical protein
MLDRAETLPGGELDVLLSDVVLKVDERLAPRTRERLDGADSGVFLPGLE